MATVEEALRAVEDLRREMGGRITALEAEVAALKAARPAADAEVAPELLVVMAAAITAYLGKKVRVRSARLLAPAQDGVSPWAQHGRVFVQAAAHDLRRVR